MVLLCCEISDLVHSILLLHYSSNPMVVKSLVTQQPFVDQQVVRGYQALHPMLPMGSGVMAEGQKHLIRGLSVEGFVVVPSRSPKATEHLLVLVT